MLSHVVGSDLVPRDESHPIRDSRRILFAAAPATFRVNLAVHLAGLIRQSAGHLSSVNDLVDLLRLGFGLVFASPLLPVQVRFAFGGQYSKLAFRVERPAPLKDSVFD